MTSHHAAAARAALLALALCLGTPSAQAQARFTLLFKDNGVWHELGFDTIEACEAALQAEGGPLARIEVSPSAVERLSPYELVALRRTGVNVRAARPGASCLFAVVHGPHCVYCWTMWMRQPIFAQPLPVPAPGDAGAATGVAGRVAFLVLGYLAFDVRRAQPWPPHANEPAQAAQAGLPPTSGPLWQLQRTMRQIVQGVYGWLVDGGLRRLQDPVDAVAPTGPGMPPVMPMPTAGPVERLGRLRIHHLPPAQAAGQQADAAAAGAEAGGAQAPAGVVQPGLRLPDALPALPAAPIAPPTLRIHLPRPRLVIHLPPGSGAP